MNPPIQSVRNAIAQHMPSYDDEVAEILLATIVANRLEGPPVWLMLIAPPSSGKTIALEPLDALPNTKLLSKLTEKTLLSGMPDQNGKPTSLLLQLGPKPVIVVKDLGTMLEMNHHGKGDLYAQLREVYDGYISAAYGNGRFVEWPGKGKVGKATMIVGMTPSIDMYHVMESHLGERFLRYQYRSSEDPESLARAAVLGTGSEEALRHALRAAYADVNRKVTMRLARGGPFAGPDTRDLAINLAVASAQARTSVIRNPYEGHAVVLTPEAEATPRLAKMLWCMAQAFCILRDEDELSDPSILQKIAIDNVRAPRRTFLLDAIARESAGLDPMTTTDFADSANLTRQTTSRHVEDLILAKVLEEVPLADIPPASTAGRPPKYYRLRANYRKVLQKAKLL